MNTKDLPKLLNTDELADFLNISKTTVYRLIEKRQIPFHRIRGGIRFNKDDVLEYLNANKIEAIK